MSQCFANRLKSFLANQSSSVPGMNHSAKAHLRVRSFPLRAAISANGWSRGIPGGGNGGGGHPKAKSFPNAADQDCVNFLAGKECKILDADDKCIFNHEGLVKGSDPEAIVKRFNKIKN